MPPNEIEVSARRGAPEQTDADTRVVGLFADEGPSDAAIAPLFEIGEAKGGLRKVAVAHEQGPDGLRRVMAAGLGKRDEFDAESARVAAAAVAGLAKSLGARSLSWLCPTQGEGIAEGLVEGTLLALYNFDDFKSKSDNDDESSDDQGENDDEDEITKLEIVNPDEDLAERVDRARTAAEAQNAARDLQNLPGNVATPTHLAQCAQEIASEFAGAGLSCEVLDRAKIEQLEMGAFASVAQGSYAEPALIVMRYDGGGSGPHLGYVGKAVTFDTGGISIKPSAKMQEMKFDMSGGAAVIEAMAAIASEGIEAKVTAVVPSTENMPSGRSVKPGDIVTAMNGKTIEVNNTDAEGRLILADALCYAVDQGCERIIDLATLTGAIIVALGSTYAGLFSNDDDWYAEVESACDATGELGWRLPLHPEYFELTKGQYADLTNASDTRKAMSIYAAEFLKQFVGETPWVHMDIAGTAWGGTRNYVGSGASGYGVRTLIDLARRAS